MFDGWKYRRAVKRLKASIADLVKDSKGSPLEGVVQLDFRRQLQDADESRRLGAACRRRLQDAGLRPASV